MKAKVFFYLYRKECQGNLTFHDYQFEYPHLLIVTADPDSTLQTDEIPKELMLQQTK